MKSSVLLASLPLIVAATTSVVVMLAIAIKRNHAGTATLSLAGLVAAFASLWPASSAVPAQIGPLLSIDKYALIYMGLILAASAAVVLLSFSYLDRRPEQKEEFYVLLILATIGSMVLTASTHVATLFLGLELLSVSLYALIAYPRVEKLPLEAGIKYLVLAASSSAFLLFGLALMYVATGSMDFGAIADIGGGAAARFAYAAAVVLVLTGIGFKLAVVPFHLWTPDVYQGAPLPVTAFVATVSKGGVFAFLLRWVRAAGQTATPLLIVLGIIAVASMLAGNLLALRQTNMKRLLAYSSIAHMGYFLVAAIAGGAMGSAAATYYLMAYIVTILGAFGSLLVLTSETRETETFDDVRGLFWSRPVAASIFTAMILSLAGIPLTAGFLGKFFVFAAGASVAAWWLVMVLIVSSTIGLVYYLRVIVAMFTAPDAETAREDTASAGFGSSLVLGALTIALFILGVYPGPLWDTIRAAAANLGSGGAPGQP
ncbi:MAG: NADH-quinone oxidoreductase subunit N [Acidobacteriaceae bacterium]|nr:NADH-quinone oxidoreductase subunit N [Acidobacteriaceae bacterium]